MNLKPQTELLEDLDRQGLEYLGAAQMLRRFFLPEDWTLNMWPENKLNEGLAELTGTSVEQCSVSAFVWPADEAKREETMGRLREIMARKTQDADLELMRAVRQPWDEQSVQRAAQAALKDIARAQSTGLRGGEALPRLLLKSLLWATRQAVPADDAEVDRLAAQTLAGVETAPAQRAAVKRLSADDGALF